MTNETKTGLKRLSYLPDRGANEPQGDLIAGQEYDNVYIIGGTISGANISGGSVTATSVVLPPVASPAYQAGKLVFDQDNDSPTFYNSDADVSLQIGQEEWIRVYNNSGAPIPNGSAVYISGAFNGFPTIALARANATTTLVCAGLATKTIANNAIGIVTCIGLVRGIDTSAFTAGATVYLSATTAGQLTTTVPAAPNYRYRIGIVGMSSATLGTIHVTPSTGDLGLGTANQLRGMNAAGNGSEYKTVNGTTNQVTVNNAANSLTLGLASPINVSTTGSAASLTTARAISIGGTSGLTATGQNFDGSAAIALPLAGTLSPANGGTGAANNAANAIAFSGNFGITFTLSATTALTLPTTGTVATLAGVETLANKTLTTPTLNQPNIVGTTTNNNAAAGSVGEYVESAVITGSAIAMTSATYLNVTSISLTAGDWDVSGSVAFVSNASTTATQFIGSISLTSATLGDTVCTNLLPMASTANMQPNLPTGNRRVSISSTTTVYLVARSTFATSTMSVYGTISARRRR